MTRKVGVEPKKLYVGPEKELSGQGTATKANNQVGSRRVNRRGRALREGNPPETS